MATYKPYMMAKRIGRDMDKVTIAITCGQWRLLRMRSELLRRDEDFRLGRRIDAPVTPGLTAGSRRLRSFR